MSAIGLKRTCTPISCHGGGALNPTFSAPGAQCQLRTFQCKQCGRQTELHCESASDPKRTPHLGWLGVRCWRDGENEVALRLAGDAPIIRYQFNLKFSACWIQVCNSETGPQDDSVGDDICCPAVIDARGGRITLNRPRHSAGLKFIKNFAPPVSRFATMIVAPSAAATR